MGEVLSNYQTLVEEKNLETNLLEFTSGKFICMLCM